MEQVVSDLLDGLRAAVEVLASAVQGFLGLFGWNVSALTAELLGLLVFAGFIVRLVFWPIVSKPSAFKPQTITLYTTKTPWEVVMGDVGGCLKSIIILLGIVLLLILIGKA
jgi:hypothetical protein